MKNTLHPNFPEGFEYYPDFISEQEEKELLDVFSGIELQALLFQGYTAKRRVASFGFNYSFDTRKLSKGEPVPEEFSNLVRKAAEKAGVSARDIEELLVTEYPEGSVINWHRDAPAFDIIIGISLLSDCRFRLRPHNKALQNRSSVLGFNVQRRSLYIMRGPTRSEWEHSISPVKSKRYSITLRTLRK